MPLPHPTWSRRHFLGASALLIGSRALPAAAPARAKRPKPPYRVWFQPTLFHREMSLYAHMTIDASGWLDPRLAEAAGKTTLNWAYAVNHPEAKGPDYWRDICLPATLAKPHRDSTGQFASAGVALDEWVNPAQPQNEAWLCEGLRAGRQANPDVFIAIWYAKETPALLELGRDGTVDLFIAEGYTHRPPEAPVDWVTSWEGALKHCDVLAQAGLEAKTIQCFGHIDARSERAGQRLGGAWLREKMGELKQRYPRMPGVAFYQATKGADTPELRELTKTCDALSAEFWPDA